MKLAVLLLVALLVGLVSTRNVKRRELSEAEQKELMQSRGLVSKNNL
ncbi:hypothetical protein B566_EDAN018446 [Ephemera danica]|nr:hypothetical protein B566_EDAN018446 [Ephemera danica]